MMNNAQNCAVAHVTPPMQYKGMGMVNFCDVAEFQRGRNGNAGLAVVPFLARTKNKQGICPKGV